MDQDTKKQPTWHTHFSVNSKQHGRGKFSRTPWEEHDPSWGFSSSEHGGETNTKAWSGHPLEVVLLQEFPHGPANQVRIVPEGGRSRDKLTPVLLLMLPVFDSWDGEARGRATSPSRGARAMSQVHFVSNKMNLLAAVAPQQPQIWEQEVLQEAVVGVCHRSVDSGHDGHDDGIAD